MANPTQIRQLVRDFIVEDFRVSDDDSAFTDDVHLFDEGYVDSLGLVRLIVFVESTFDVKLEETHLFSDTFTSVNGIAQIVASLPTRSAGSGRPPGNVSQQTADVKGPVRPFTENDLDAVVRLYEVVMRSGKPEPPAGLKGYFTRFFLEHPHATPDIPSLVFEDVDRGVCGFLGVHVRRFLWGERPLRMACVGPFVVDEEGRAKGVGGHLLKAFLSGPQDFSLTDGGTPEIVGMWENLGGFLSPTGNTIWIRPFRPWEYLWSRLSQKQLPRSLSAAGRPVCTVVDGLTRSFSGRFKTSPPDGVRAEALHERNLREALEAVAPTLAVRPDYDAAYLQWLLEEVQAVRSRGKARGVLLRSTDGTGTVRGWYLYYLQRAGVSQALQVAARPGSEKVALEHLFYDAEHRGSLAIEGRVEPWLLQPLSELFVALSSWTARAIVHCPDARLRATLFTDRSLLTRLDGEWWAGFHLEASDMGHRHKWSIDTA